MELRCQSKLLIGCIEQNEFINNYWRRFFSATCCSEQQLSCNTIRWLNQHRYKMLKIEGHDCTLFHDYDFHRDKILQQLTEDGKITWLEARMKMIFLEPISSLFDKSSKASIDLGTPQNGIPRTGTLISVSVLMNGIEALGSFITNNGSKKDNFFAFVNKYLPAWAIEVNSPQRGNQKIALTKILWKEYRNGLAHSFAIGGAGVDTVQGIDKYKIDGNTLQIDIWKFFNDFKMGVTQMLDDFRTDKKSRKQFMKRFKEVYKC